MHDFDKIPCFVINLEGSTQRYDAVSDQLHSVGLRFERLDAFDGRGVDLEAEADCDTTAALRYMGRPLRGGEYGCYKSHLRAAEAIVRSGAAYGVVFEDDIAPVAPIKAALGEIIASFEQSGRAWDVVNLGVGRLKYTSPIAKLSGGHTLLAAHYFPMTTSGLLWSRAGAERFITHHAAVTMPVDNALREIMTRSQTGFAVWPPLVRQVFEGSDIDAGSGKRSVEGRLWSYGLRKQRRLLRAKASALWHKLRFALTSR